MGVTVLFYKLFQFKDDLAAILKRCCCHGNIHYKIIPTTVRLLTCSSIRIDPPFLPKRTIIGQNCDLKGYGNIFLFWLIDKNL